MASEEPLFDPTLVKKKKKKVIDLDDFDAELKKSSAPAPAAAEPAATESAPAAPAEKVAEAPASEAAPAAEGGDAAQNGDEADLFGGLKKKSKKKKALPLDLDDAAEGGEQAAAPADGAEGGAEGDLDFGELKKKTKKSKKKAFDLDAFEKELDGGDGSGAEGGEGGAESRLDTDRDLGDDPFAQDDGGADGADAGGDAADAWLGSDRDYTYQELLTRIFKTLRAQNPALSGDRKKYSIVPPNVQRDGSKKTMFANIYDICKRMHRQPEHVLQYLFSELGTIGSFDGQQRLIIKGRFTQKQIEHVLRTYIVEYVTCKTCKSPNTLLTKENRIYFMTCESCGSTRSVQTIRAGFMAQTTKRKKM